MVLVALLLLGSWSPGEVIDGPANVRDKPNGRKLYSLVDDSVVSAVAKRGYWYEIVFQVLIDDRAAAGSDLVPARATLKNSYGITIGTSFVETAAQRVQRTDNGLLLTLRGWTHEDNIRSDAVVNEALERLLSPAPVELTLERFYPFLSRYDFEEWMSADQFRNYIFYSSALDDPSPGPELLLFFYRGRLSFLLHRNPIHSPRISEQWHVSGLSVSAVDEPAREVRRELEARYLELIRRAD